MVVLLECQALVLIPVNKAPAPWSTLLISSLLLLPSGAVYLEGGLEEARQLFGRLLFNSEVPAEALSQRLSGRRLSSLKLPPSGQHRRGP